jgi:hypothetical protein
MERLNRLLRGENPSAESPLPGPFLPAVAALPSAMTYVYLLFTMLTISLTLLLTAAMLGRILLPAALAPDEYVGPEHEEDQGSPALPETPRATAADV